MPDYFESGFMVEEPAWHKMGTVIPRERADKMTVPEFIVAASLNWSVLKVPLYVGGQETFLVGKDVECPIPEQLRGRRATGRFGVFRDSDFAFIGDVGSQYEPLQNEEAFAWFNPWLESGVAKLETAGSLYGGAVVWVLARCDAAEDEIIPGDTVRRYILLSTSHDGSQATHAGFTDIRTVCANTLRLAQRSRASQLLRVKHTASQHETLGHIRETMDLANQEFAATAEQFRRLARCPISRDDLVKYVKVVLEVDDDDGISTRKSNQIEKIVSLADSGRGSELAGGTVWGAYNGFTEWLSYERGRNDETRLKSLWFGDGARLNQRALDVAIQVAA